MTLADRLISEGAIACGVFDHAMQIQMGLLVEDGIALLCSDIPHHERMINPGLTYVTNDDAGRKLAVDVPLFTRVLQ